MELLHILLIAVVVILSLGAVGLAAVIAFRVHRWRAGRTTRVSLPAPVDTPRVRTLPEPRPAIERPQEVHLHPHGVSAEDVAALLARDLPQPGVNRQEPPHVP